MAKWIWIFALVMSLPAWGLDSRYRRALSSDDIQLRSLSLGESIERGWKLNAESLQLNFRGDATQRLHSLGFQKEVLKTSEHRIYAGWTLAVLDGSKNRERGLGRVGYAFQSEKFQLNLDGKQILPAQNMAVLRSEMIDLYEEALSLRMALPLPAHFKLQSFNEWGWNSRSRHKALSDYALMYAISPGWPWIWIGYGYYELKYSERDVGYWSPEHFKSHGLRVDTSFPIYFQWSGILALNLNNYNEDGFSGKGHYAVGGFQWGSSQETHFKATWTQIRSGQSSSPWKYDELSLNFSIPL